MLRRVARSPALKRGLATPHSAKPPLTSLNNAAAAAQLGLDGTLEEVAASHFSEASAFPEFSPMEDALLGQAVPRIPQKTPVMDAHARAEEALTQEMQQHFCEPSDFPEYTPAEEEAMMHKEIRQMRNKRMLQLDRSELVLRSASSRRFVLTCSKQRLESNEMDMTAWR
ncbi:unnamed protein product [Phytophthora lilii]|uniref:Unnamed protein product n=1 Tax=Phytophthora lilii TaxID=2077276 RepID=A0A9W6TUL3_9STRA|nr:unnamed protein product [Phytophthora lilii]